MEINTLCFRVKEMRTTVKWIQNDAHFVAAGAAADCDREESRRCPTEVANGYERHLHHGKKQIRCDLIWLCFAVWGVGTRGFTGVRGRTIGRPIKRRKRNTFMRVSSISSLKKMQRLDARGRGRRKSQEERGPQCFQRVIAGDKTNDNIERGFVIRSCPWEK